MTARILGGLVRTRTGTSRVQRPKCFVSVHRFVRKYATSAGSNLEYDFARRVRTSTVLEGFTCAGERKYFGDDRLELSFIHECGVWIQLPAISIDNEKNSTGAVLLTDTGRNRRN